MLGNNLISEKNRYQNCLTVSNLPLDAVFSNPFGKSSQAVMNEVLSGHVEDEERILSVVHGHCKNKGKIMDAIREPVSVLTRDSKSLISELIWMSLNSTVITYFHRLFPTWLMIWKISFV